MVLILVSIIAIFILDQFINRRLIKRKNIEVPELKFRRVNRIHENGEKILYFVNLLVMIQAIMFSPHLRIFIFIGPGFMFAFRTFMEWKYAADKQTYLLSGVTCGLFIIGSVVFAVIDAFT
ncbi:DUF4181 domain-containing protein [Alkalihalobacillus sp. MEB130]|uniref:DUF4181 domain-containing protein n=1 Tax=Alkalihalobacillus sp. MEB130 TaxID=2976704 RepID=UPI0028DE1F1E|nr:DUF4181 domain-containing protein [Alkalihalobacillus sp. MEB130]MDT8862789.1 DUF4181 domain-containing protein [Alkalihalobacillus sp. MEB130]